MYVAPPHTPPQLLSPRFYYVLPAVFENPGAAAAAVPHMPLGVDKLMGRAAAHRVAHGPQGAQGHMRSGGHLALVASIAGVVSNYGYAAYSSSKFGVVGLASALRIECRTQGIGVSVICPPEVETPMVEEERRTAPAVTMQTKQFAGTVSLDDLCTQVVHGLEQGRFMIVPGSWRARFTVFLGRTFPRLMASVT